MKIENNNLNIPAVSVTALIELLGTLYANAITQGIPLRTLPAPFLWGPAGIGKSEGIYELAALLGERTGKSVKVTDVRLLLFSPVDLRGVPVADAQRRFTDWLMPRIFDMEQTSETVNLLFLDELSAAPQSVQAAAYQITLDRKIGEHRLPDNCIVIAAGNRTTDQSVAYQMPKALCNRLMHFDVQSDFDSWKLWAVERGIDSRIIGYLSFDRSRLCLTPERSDLAYPTPRSWTFVSDVIRAMKTEELSQCHTLISACVGTDTAISFSAWCKVCRTLPSAEEILCGRYRSYPKTQDALYALSSGLVEAVRMREDRLRLEELENVCSYASHFPPDFAMMFFKDLNALPKVRLQLMKCRALQDWLAKNRRRL